MVERSMCVLGLETDYCCRAWEGHSSHGGHLPFPFLAAVTRLMSRHKVIDIPIPNSGFNIKGLNYPETLFSL